MIEVKINYPDGSFLGEEIYLKIDTADQVVTKVVNKLTDLIENHFDIIPPVYWEDPPPLTKEELL